MSDDAEPIDLDEQAMKAVEEQADAGAEPQPDAQPTPDDKPADEPPKPGTPDRVLQKMQQELGNVTRQLASLTAKQESGDAMTQQDQAKLAKAQERVSKIREFLGRPEREDLPSEVDPVAETVLELTEKVGDQETLKAELRQATQRLAVLENDRAWQIARTRFKGVDVDAVWGKALNDAGETLGDTATPAAVHRLASRWFEERCEAAKKRIGGEDRANNRAAGQPSAPSQYRVGSGQRAAPVLSDEEEALAMARQLIVET